MQALEGLLRWGKGSAHLAQSASWGVAYLAWWQDKKQLSDWKQLCGLLMLHLLSPCIRPDHWQVHGMAGWEVIAEVRIGSLLQFKIL